MHVGIIMDGNRRWAKQQGVLKVIGHQNGAATLENLLQFSPKYGIDVLSIYAFSTENNRRDKKEVESIFKLMKKFADDKLNTFLKNNIKVKFLGNIKTIPEEYSKSLLKLEKETQKCNDFLLQICVNYGARDEITRSVKSLIKNGLEITEENISTYLDSNLEPELIIRTGGNQRLSNFLLWQGAYSELYFTNTLWPNFNETELSKAIEFYNSQKRNFGK